MPSRSPLEHCAGLGNARTHNGLGVHATQVRGTNLADEIPIGIPFRPVFRYHDPEPNSPRWCPRSGRSRKLPSVPARRGGRMTASIGPTVRRRRLGTELRRLREAHAIKLEEVADKLGLAASTLSRIETGKAPTRTAYLAAMLDLYGVKEPGQRQILIDMAREGHRKGWW